MPPKLIRFYRVTRTVLLLATTTGYQTQAFAEAARKLEARVFFGTDRCHRLEDPWHDGALPLHFHRPQGAAKEIVEFAQKQPVDAIVAVGDAPVLTAALASAMLNLPHHSAPGAAASRDKHHARQVLQDAGLRTPQFIRMPLQEQAPDPPAGLPFPCVLKPVSLSGSRGVIRADNAEEFRAAFERIAALITGPDVQARKDENTPYILVEGFIEGREFALEGLMDRGKLLPLSLFDKPDPLDGPYFEETIYVTPSRLPPDSQQAITDAVSRACAALGLEHGPIHAEVRLNARGVWVLEVAGRPIGGLCAKALRFQGGVGLEELIVRHALGLPFDPRREKSASGVMMIPIPQEGLLQEVQGLHEAQSVPGVEEITITAKAGEKLVPWPEGSSYLGFIFARSETPAEAERSLRLAHAKLKFVTAPSLPVLSGR